MSESFRIELSSSPRLLQVVRAVVSQYGRLLELAEEETFRLKTAVDEACANVIRHSYGGDTGQRIVLTFTLSEDRLEILLRDFGKKPGGLGLPLILHVMDEVAYDLSPEKGSALRMVKYLRGRDRE